MASEAKLLIIEFLKWVAARPRSVVEARQAWSSTCPLNCAWEDAITEDLIEHGAGGRLALTARGEAGRIGLGFTSSASFHPLVPRVIRAFREAHPLVALSLEEGGTAELVEGLRAERIDAAFVRSPIGPAAELTVHSVLEEEMVAALPAGHRLADGAQPAGCRWPNSGLKPSSCIAGRSGPGFTMRSSRPASAPAIARRSARRRRACCRP